MLRVGILFGGSSREREVSFAGGRTVYDLLDKSLFEPIPLFLDSLGNLVELHWTYLYKGTIRDFYPPASYQGGTDYPWQIYIESLSELQADERLRLLSQIGRPLRWDELPQRVDLVFLALHGTDGEDGSVQGMLELLRIPYTGSGILPSAIGMDKAFQKKIMKEAGLQVPRSVVLHRQEWLNGNRRRCYEHVRRAVGFPLVIRPANQGSSIGVTSLHEDSYSQFCAAVDRAFFTHRLTAQQWNKLSEQQAAAWVQQLCEIKEGIGLPIRIGEKIIYHPETLFRFLSDHFRRSKQPLWLYSLMEEKQVLAEEFIEGTEFSCIVIRNEDGRPFALPPTEIRKASSVFDYRSKYLAGMSRKITPMELSDRKVEQVRQACERLFSFFDFHVYARIDGFVRRRDGAILLNDPNTTSGMMPSSFFFHQAAEIGLDPTQFLTYVVRTSLWERLQSGKYSHVRPMLKQLDEVIARRQQQQQQKVRVAVILGGYSSERHISVESGRNVYEKLASSTQYRPLPVFLLGNARSYKLYQIPINLLLKDNADDIAEHILHRRRRAMLTVLCRQAAALRRRYGSSTYLFEPRRLTWAQLRQMCDKVFIALHGRPGEDGTLQQALERIGLPYNGSGPESSQLTIDKYATNELLARHGLRVPRHQLFYRKQWRQHPRRFFQLIEEQFSYPFICKPVDDGCSAAVKKIEQRSQLEAYCKLLFRNSATVPKGPGSVLGLQPSEEFPAKDQMLVEELITRGSAVRFLEITGGMLIHRTANGQLRYEVFEPSEVLASDQILSLEEKFLAGEGQNITPARFAEDPAENERITKQVKAELEKAARVANVRGYCRIDAFVRIYEKGTVETIILEINSLPGMTPATCLFHQAALHHYRPLDLIDQILKNA
ncbi:MAG: hypothetical protein NZL95_06445 [Chitinophagales bacterium]|nr:hypothetical protein [Chitinophagales bacterium]MDW8428177.1 hypothetical protein [Chitinophagales bacterium]